MSGFPFTIDATSGLIEHHPYNVNGVVTALTKAPPVANVVTGWSDEIRVLPSWNVIRGDPLLLDDYNMKGGLKHTQTPIAADCIVLRADAKTAPLMGVGLIPLFKNPRLRSHCHYSVHFCIKKSNILPISDTHIPSRSLSEEIPGRWV
jgi:hypothetical protein